MSRDRVILHFWRRWLPAALCLIGIVILIADNFNLFGVSAFAAFCGAGLSVALTNLLWRIGISGNRDRDDEEDARQYLAQHGHWPEDTPERWTPTGYADLPVRPAERPAQRADRPAQRADPPAQPADHSDRPAQPSERPTQPSER